MGDAAPLPATAAAAAAAAAATEGGAKAASASAAAAVDNKAPSALPWPVPPIVMVDGRKLKLDTFASVTDELGNLWVRNNVMRGIRVMDKGGRRGTLWAIRNYETDEATERWAQVQFDGVDGPQYCRLQNLDR
jgi:hypothetical protein